MEVQYMFATPRRDKIVVQPKLAILNDTVDNGTDGNLTNAMRTLRFCTALYMLEIALGKECFESKRERDCEGRARRFVELS